VIAAGLLLAALLILIGILVATTAATGSTHTQTVTARSPGRPAQAAAAVHPNPAKAAALQADQATISKLRAQLSAQTGQLSSAAASLRAARANARCWHSKVIHPIKTRTLHCVAPLPPSASTP
jgi:alpha/beta superfamily hydrolase